MTESASWAAIVRLIESVSTSREVLATAVDDARSSSRALAALDPADIARRTRDLMTAATRAIAARRDATDAELAFVEDLAVTRAKQGIPITDVLRAIHVASRRIWAATREQADADGVDPALVLAARELYEDWAESVRERLLAAHRAAQRSASGAHHRHEDLIRRLLQGGSAGALAAQEAGLADGPVWVGVTTDAAALDVLRQWLSARPWVGVAGTDGDVVVVATAHRLPAEPPHRMTLGLAGPGTSRDVPVLRRLAESAAAGGSAVGRHGVIHIGEIASVAALMDRHDLKAALIDRYSLALAGLQAQRRPTTATVRRWLECGRDATATAAAHYVHPNTVRNRVAALATATGLDPHDPFDALTLWWLCRAEAAAHDADAGPAALPRDRRART